MRAELGEPFDPLADLQVALDGQHQLLDLLQRGGGNCMEASIACFKR
jgi:hypothetical protein